MGQNWLKKKQNKKHQSTYPRSSKTPSRIMAKRITVRHIMVKLLKDKNKESLESIKRKSAHHIKVTLIRLRANFSSEAMWGE